MTKLIIKNAEGEILKELDAEVNKTLLKQLEAEGVEIPAACYTGIC
jgi:ferredoxin